MNDQSLTIRAYEEPGRHVLELVGELDLADVGAFQAAARQLQELRPRELLVDISNVAFIDSSGVRAILAVKSSYESQGCEFSMTHAGDADRVFELARLLDHLPFRHRRPERFRREIELTPEARGPAREPADG